MKKIPVPCMLSFVVLILLCAAASAQNWPQFRGPGARGVSDETGLPDRWSPETNVLWKAEIPGRGWSSPIIWGDRVFLTTCVNEGKDVAPRKGLYPGGERRSAPDSVHRWIVYCLDFETGKVRWQKTAYEGKPTLPIHIKNTYASEAPVTDGERVFAYFGNAGLYAYDMDGKLLWDRRWDPVKTTMNWGTASSPALHGDRLYVVNDNEGTSFLEALDKTTGKTVWKVERDEKSNWATPFVWENELRTEIVTVGSGKVRSYDLEGKLLWQLVGMSSITIPTPFASRGLLYVSSGFVLSRAKPIYAIKPGAKGDISLTEGKLTNEHIVWCQPRSAPYNPSIIVYGDYLYSLLDSGIISCFDAKTGKEIYPKKRIGSGMNVTTSPWAYGDKIFCLNEDGDTFVVQAGPEFKVLGENSLGEMCMASPAMARGSLFIRTITKLYRIGSTNSGS